MRRKIQRKRSAFTLMEVLLVAGILALLAAFAIPRLMETATAARIDIAKASIGPNGPIAQALELYKYHKYFYSVILSDLADKFESLFSIECREFFISFWADTLPSLVGYEINTERAEEYYLSRLGEYDPVVFLSPSHIHMEIMSLDAGYLQRLSEIARKTMLRE